MTFSDKLSDRYRPKSFAEVLGQDEVVAWFRAEVRSGRGSGAILHGPHGLGKTSAARIYARAILCRQSWEEGSPCGQCEECLLFDSECGHPSYREVDCAKDGRVEVLLEELELLRFSSLFNPRQVLVLDEADRITSRAIDLLKTPLENPKLQATVLLLTNKFEELPKPIISRAVDLKFKPLTFESGLRHLKHVCEAESIAYDLEALTLIAETSGGHVRDMMTSLDRVSARTRTVTTADVRKILSLDYMDIVVQYVRAVLTSDLQKQVSIIEAWPDPARVKVDAIQRLLVYLFTTEVMRLFQIDTLMGSILKEDRQWIVEQMALRAKDSAISVREFWQETVDFWNPPTEVTKSSLIAKIVKFDTFMNLADSSVSHTTRSQ